MTNEERKAKNKQRREEYYQNIADDIYSLYMSFYNVGFDNNQAFELVSHYLRQSILDNIIKEEITKQRDNDRLRRRNRELLDKLNGEANHDRLHSSLS